MPQRNQTVTLDYAPRSQFLPLHQRTKRWAVVVAHRRAGKTVACINECIIRALHTTKKRPQYAYVAPFYSQAKSVAWEYLKDAARPLVNSLKDIRESELKVTLFNGASIRLYGADNPDALRGIYNDGVILDEFGDCRPGLWGEVILPTLADRQGWAIIIGTPKGKNAFYALLQDAQNDPDNWLAMVLKASETGILPASEIDIMRAQMSEAQYNQEFECSFSAPVLGTYYAAQIEELEQSEQIYCPRKATYDPQRPVHIAADLGYTDSTAFWFWQERPEGAAIIDYYECHGEPLQHYVNKLNSLPYDYGTVWLPHDARAKTLQTGRTTAEQFQEAGFNISIVPRLKVQQGIDAARMVLPHCYFNEAASEGVEALRAYRRTYNEATKTYNDNPLHNWASNGADAFRYFALVAKINPLKGRNKQIIDQTPIDGYHLNALFKDNERDNSLSIAGMRI